MSLLMDALKKAEKDKKSAQAREGEERELELSDKEESTRTLETSELPVQLGPEDETMATERLEAYEIPSPRSEFSLEPMELTASESTEVIPRPGDISEEIDLNSLSISGSGEFGVSGEFGQSGEFTGSGEFENSAERTRPEGDITGDGTGSLDSTMPSERAVKDELENYFADSMSIQRSDVFRDHTNTMSQTVVESGLSQHAQVTAETVFSAGKAQKKRSSLTPILVIVLLMLVIAGAGLYMYTLVPQTSHMPSPMVASQIQPVPAMPPGGPVGPAEAIAPLANDAAGIETIVPVPVVTPVETAVVTQIVADEPAGIMEPAVPEETADPVLEGVESDNAPDVAGSVANTEPEAVSPETVEPEVVTTETSKASASQPQEAPLREQIAPQTYAAAPPREPVAPLRITRSSKTNAISAMLHSAWLAYQGGNDEVAAATYRSVLKQQPDNRDAILGQAALALKNEDMEQAYQHYRKLLRLNPRDTVASTALFALQGYQDSPVVTESRLKLMLDSNPDSAHIHFSLGNLYARQQRWALAQQSFFDAYRLDSERADYAYNLAVSLDQLQQSAAALQYYRRAQLLAQQQTVNFPVSRLMSRIDALTARVEQQP